MRYCCGTPAIVGAICRFAGRLGFAMKFRSPVRVAAVSTLPNSNLRFCRAATIVRSLATSHSPLLPQPPCRKLLLAKTLNDRYRRPQNAASVAIHESSSDKEGAHWRESSAFSGDVSLRWMRWVVCVSRKLLTWSNCHNCLATSMYAAWKLQVSALAQSVVRWHSRGIPNPWASCYIHSWVVVSQATLEDGTCLGGGTVPFPSVHCFS